MLEDLARGLELSKIEPVIDRVSFDEAPAAYEYLASGAHVEKVVIRV
jgi:NADPH:quinone reductase-like Zn-dependent oxidoreductase